MMIIASHLVITHSTHAGENHTTLYRQPSVSFLKKIATNLAETEQFEDTARLYDGLETLFSFDNKRVSKNFYHYYH